MKYRFKILHCPLPLQEVIRKMKTLDCNLEGLGLEDIMELTSSHDIPIEEVKKHLIEAYASVDSVVLNIETYASLEGGDIE